MTTEPKPSTLRKLFLLSGNRCAFRGRVEDERCARELLIEDTITGQICHISAESKGGPRWDENLNDEDRRSFGNLMLMCGDHHKLVDTQVSDFQPDMLLRWKEEHEVANRSRDVPDVGDQVLWQFVQNTLVINTSDSAAVAIATGPGAHIEQHISHHYYGASKPQVAATPPAKQPEPYHRPGDMVWKDGVLAAHFEGDDGEDWRLSVGPVWAAERAAIHRWHYGTPRFIDRPNINDSSLLALATRLREMSPRSREQLEPFERQVLDHIATQAALGDGGWVGVRTLGHKFDFEPGDESNALIDQLVPRLLEREVRQLHPIYRVTLAGLLASAEADRTLRMLRHTLAAIRATYQDDPEMGIWSWSRVCEFGGYSNASGENPERDFACAVVRGARWSTNYHRNAHVGGHAWSVMMDIIVPLASCADLSEYFAKLRLAKIPRPSLTAPLRIVMEP